jgi:quinol monooxygenase YgiN
MPVIVATVIPKPEFRDEVKEALVVGVAGGHEDAGCELYALHEGKDRFVFVEKWATPQDMAAHGKGAALAAMGKALDGKLVSPLDVQILEPVPAGDPAKGQLRP